MAKKATKKKEDKALNLESILLNCQWAMSLLSYSSVICRNG